MFKVKSSLESVSNKRSSSCRTENKPWILITLTHPYTLISLLHHLIRWWMQTKPNIHSKQKCAVHLSCFIFECTKSFNFTLYVHSSHLIHNTHPPHTEFSLASAKFLAFFNAQHQKFYLKVYAPWKVCNVYTHKIEELLMDRLRM